MKPRRAPDELLEDVYGRRCGWRMFDANLLTPGIADFLSRERKSLLETLDTGAFSGVVEVGCGYGRYGAAVAGRGRKYLGIDLIAWLTQLGGWHLSAQKVAFGLETVSVADLNRGILERHGLAAGAGTLVFLPFNCLGNISYIDRVVGNLSGLGVGIACALFNGGSETDAVRAAYYARCGLRGLAASREKAGSVIRSEEGFESIGYHAEYFEALMRRHGYAKRSHAPLGGCGGFYVFCREGAASIQGNSAGVPPARQPGAVPLQELRKKIPVLRGAHLHTLETGKPAGARETGLLGFTSVPVANYAAIENLRPDAVPGFPPVGILEVETRRGSLFHPVLF